MGETGKTLVPLTTDESGRAVRTAVVSSCGSSRLDQAAMDAVKPGVRVVAELFPRFGATDFSTEITRLQALRPDVIFSTSWGGELDTFIRQAAERRLFERSTFVLPLVESSLERVGKTLPEGVIVGGRGDHWFLHPTAKDTPILKDFTAAYRQRFNLYPIYPTFHMAQALYGLAGR